MAKMVIGGCCLRRLISIYPISIPRARNYYVSRQTKSMVVEQHRRQWTKVSDSDLTRSFSGKSNETLNDLMSNIEETAYKLLYVTVEDDDKMKLASLYSQATEGKCDAKQPKDPLELKYWDGWSQLGDMTKEEAGKKYLELAKKYLK